MRREEKLAKRTIAKYESIGEEILVKMKYIKLSGRLFKKKRKWKRGEERRKVSEENNSRKSL